MALVYQETTESLTIKRRTIDISVDELTRNLMEKLNLAPSKSTIQFNTENGMVLSVTLIEQMETRS